jgi:hypothetical protein
MLLLQGLQRLELLPATVVRGVSTAAARGWAKRGRGGDKGRRMGIGDDRGSEGMLRCLSSTNLSKAFDFGFLDEAAAASRWKWTLTS